MRKLAPVLMVLIVLGCGTGEVRLYESEARQRQVTVKKLDPKIFEDREKSLSLSVGIPLPGGVKVSPGIEFARKAQMEWNDIVKEVIGEYLVLVREHNEGKITLREYWRRRGELDKALVRMALQQPVAASNLKEIEQYAKLADAAHAELEAELAKLKGKAVPADTEVKPEELQKQARERLAVHTKDVATELAVLKRQLEQIKLQKQGGV